MYRIGIIFNGARGDHEILSPVHESYEEARAEFRAVNKQRLEAPMLERSWAQLSSDSILAVHIAEEP
jgi:hypothetical protein